MKQQEIRDLLNIIISEVIESESNYERMAKSSTPEAVGTFKNLIASSDHRVARARATLMELAEDA